MQLWVKSDKETIEKLEQEKSEFEKSIEGTLEISTNLERELQEIQIAYAIGRNEPVSVHVDSFGTSKIDEEKIVEIIYKVFDLRPGMIIKNFSLTKPAFEYHKLTNYGHLGRPDLDIPWEKLDKVF